MTKVYIGSAVSGGAVQSSPYASQADLTAVKSGTIPLSDATVAATGSTAPRALKDRWADVVNVKDYGAVGDGVTDDSAAIQAALNTGKHVVFEGGTYKIGTSLYLKNSGQEISGAAVITMDAGLGKPCLWLGAADATGTPTGPISNVKVRGLRFLGSGTKTAGSAGIAFVSATTTTIDSVFSWQFYAGIDIRGVSLVNYVANADLRYNYYGFYDRTDASTTINFQGSVISGGRYEGNASNGLVLGSSDVRVIGTTFEGNGLVANGGDGATSEIRITPGFTNGSVDLTDLYMEITGGGAPVGMIQVDATTNKKLTIVGGNFYGNDAANRYIVNDLSAGTVKGYAFLGGTYTTFKNWVKGTIANDSTATIMPAWTDASRDAAADLSATAGATIYQNDRLLGVKTGLPFNSTVASGSNAIQLTQGARLKLGPGAADYLYSDGSRVKSDGSIVAINMLVNGGAFQNFSSVATEVKGGSADGSGAVAVKFTNTNALSTAGARALQVFSDSSTTEVAAIRTNGTRYGLRLQSPDGTWYLLTIANGGTVTVTANP